MRVVAAIVGMILILTVLQDSFEAVILPRRVTRKLRLARIFYRNTWMLWSKVARKIRTGSRREYFISFYGPPPLMVYLTPHHSISSHEASALTIPLHSGWQNTSEHGKLRVVLMSETFASRHTHERQPTQFKRTA